MAPGAGTRSLVKPPVGAKSAAGRPPYQAIEQEVAAMLRSRPLVDNTLTDTGSRRRPWCIVVQARPNGRPKTTKVLLRRVGLGGIEPPTSALSVLRSNRLSYSPSAGAYLAAPGTGGYSLALQPGGWDRLVRL
jgi:hypothetical protein